jgi:hypothetical protein
MQVIRIVSLWERGWRGIVRRGLVQLVLQEVGVVGRVVVGTEGVVEEEGLERVEEEGDVVAEDAVGEDAVVVVEDEVAVTVGLEFTLLNQDVIGWDMI